MKFVVIDLSLNVVFVCAIDDESKKGNTIWIENKNTQRHTRH
jgi:hypothetical protein